MCDYIFVLGSDHDDEDMPELIEWSEEIIAEFEGWDMGYLA